MNGDAAVIALFSGMDAPLTYKIPDALIGKVGIGSMVRVPLRSRLAEGVAIELQDSASLNFKLKEIRGLVQPQRVLTPDLIKLALWMKDYYCASMQGVMESMIPAVVRSGKNPMLAKEIALARKLEDEELEKLSRRAPAQAKLYEIMLEENAPMLRAALLKMAHASDSAVQALISKGIFCEREKILNRASYRDEIAEAERISATPHKLNPEQAQALNAILEKIESKKYATHLLYGVTGSGKTEVYMQAMQRVLENGGSCIFLVPEISLTPQTVGRLRSRLGGLGTELVVWHSGLSDGQRLDAWRAIAEGRARVVVGARSCVFAPIENPDLIIVDEEHDGAYKQDKNPRYNGRDAAVMRASISNSVCVLGSATPSLETLYNVRQKKYSQSIISSRIDGAQMPKIKIVDMKYEKPNALLSNMLINKLFERMENGQQAMLFLNRRGYSKVYECPDCGHVEQCPHCALSMTWHPAENIVKCHMCGYQKPAPSSCSECGSKNAKWHIFGTQKIEEAVKAIFPQARVGRMDADTMKRKDDYRKILAEFRRGNLDILIGTQMIAKGLDFPRVTLVGVVNADISLHIPDFRAAEHTYQLIVQVAGRAGRGGERGEVVIQTRTPEAPPIQYAKTNDMQSFLEEELASRIEYNYPPSTRLIRHIFKSRSLEKLEFYAEKWAQAAEAQVGQICQIRGPIPAPIEKIEDFYRWQIWYFCPSVCAVTKKLNALRQNFKFDDEVQELLDIDPYDLS
ncbi:MAG: primosomal protein N' [Opitutales bacterium]|nr:primosomal protein N' [Opitutales bacterium]